MRFNPPADALLRLLTGTLCIATILLIFTAPIAPGAVGLSAPEIASTARPAALPGTPVPIGPSFPTPIHHVVVVMMENSGLSQVLKGAPFETYLWNDYAHASAYYGLCHPSLGNYLAATSGVAIGCGTDNYYTYSLSNIADLTSSQGLTWMSFAENMSAPCSAANSSVFSNVFTPLLHYKDIAGNASYCDGHILPVTAGGAWYQDINGTMPNFVWYAPNKLDNGHSSSLATGDTWLKGWLSPLLNRSWAASTAFLLAFDEGSNNSGFSTSGTSTPTCTTSGATSACGGQVWMVAVSPYSKAAVASDYTATATHYNLLSTAEWLLGLGSTGHNDSGGSFAPMKALFASPVPDPGNFTVTGRVGVQSTGSAIPGADVAILGGASTVTNASGTFEFRLADGNYSLSASASGFAPSSSRVEVNGSNVSITLALVPLPPSTYSVSGVVEYAANGTPATGANLSLSGVGSAVTGTNGTFRFLAENGSYTLAIRLPGFVAQQVKVGVAGSSVIQDISLVRIAPLTYLLDGTVRSVATHAPIIGANVSVTPSVWDTTNSSGRYEFQLSNGTYTVQVSDKGYLTTHADVTLLGAPVAEDFSIASGSASSVPGNSSNSSTPTAPQPSPPTVFGPSVPVSVWPILAVAGAVVLAAGAVLRRRRRHRA